MNADEEVTLVDKARHWLEAAAREDRRLEAVLPAAVAKARFWARVGVQRLRAVANLRFMGGDRIRDFMRVINGWPYMKRVCCTHVFAFVPFASCPALVRPAGRRSALHASAAPALRCRAAPPFGGGALSHCRITAFLVFANTAVRCRGGG